MGTFYTRFQQGSISGNHGTRLDGIFVFNGSRLDWTHIVGTAKDNKGNKYRVIGPVT